MGKANNTTFTEEQGRVFGSETRRLRKDAGFKLRHFSELIGVSENYMCKIEHGKKSPSPQLAERIASAFDLTVEQMLEAKPSEDRVWEFRRNYGAMLKEHREAKGLPCRVIAGALGVSPQVYKEWEQGLCSVTEYQMEMLGKLLGIGEKPKIETVEVVVEVPAEVPTEICDIILGHIKDLGDDVDAQKKVWRFFTDMRIAAEERRLFG